MYFNIKLNIFFLNFANFDFNFRHFFSFFSGVNSENYAIWPIAKFRKIFTVGTHTKKNCPPPSPKMCPPLIAKCPDVLENIDKVVRKQRPISNRKNV